MQHKDKAVVNSFSSLIRSIYLLFVLFILLTGCGKSDVQQQEDMISEDTEESDTTLTPQEVLSTSLVQGILGEEDEPALETYIENELFEEMKSSNRATIEKISATTFFLEFESGGQMRSYILKKFYNPQKDEFFFIRSSAEDKEVKALE